MKPKKGDRTYNLPPKDNQLNTEYSADITLTLTFIRVLPMDRVNEKSSDESMLASQPKGLLSYWKSAMLTFFRWTSVTNQLDQFENIDPLAPLVLLDGRKVVFPDFLGIHMVRDAKGSTIISYHHDMDGSTTSAKAQFTRMKLVGHSVYW